MSHTSNIQNRSPVFRKVMAIREARRVFRNWISFLVVLSGLTTRKASTVLKLRKGCALKIRIPSDDAYNVFEAWGLRVYTPIGFEVRDQNVVLDIGAGIGDFSLFAASSARSVSVYSFEPFQANYELLNENIRLNGLEASVKAFALGLSAVSDTRQLHLGTTGSRNTLYGDGGQTVQINTVSLQTAFTICGIDHCDLLKMDCEGAEFEALSAASPELLACIARIVMEYHEIPGLYKLEQMVALLQDRGYRVSVLPPPETILCAIRPDPTAPR